ncbi:TnsA endonuclease N-terminal domain-containing protein [Nostoc sp. 'Lobaria pulmonaria (5183) cyanobiont']|uniref:TnsA endonuclease N-terminal domain-containing protein n=1 Tax=Nostoc sp. 'Lobaria pulmonaria (5183) cyanobiont' TaxID=1618022 RepID=UPI0018F8A09E|nr:TnsA endonuclease N-terminal domain-containing protein [Nostoc sp. 'Lobaria pulmonaria (5183) cyanobiont']
MKIQDFPSKVRVSRPPDWKTNREHYLLSDNEKRLFYVFEWLDTIVDIREQFPLIDLDLAMSIAEEIGINYPKDPQSNTPRVLTTDFMLSVKQGKTIVQKARTLKLTKDLGSKSVAEKFELEKRYYAAKGIDWGIITEKEVPKQLNLIYVENRSFCPHPKSLSQVGRGTSFRLPFSQYWEKGLGDEGFSIHTELRFSTWTQFSRKC